MSDRVWHYSRAITEAETLRALLSEPRSRLFEAWDACLRDLAEDGPLVAFTNARQAAAGIPIEPQSLLDSVHAAYIDRPALIWIAVVVRSLIGRRFAEVEEWCSVNEPPLACHHVDSSPTLRLADLVSAVEDCVPVGVLVGETDLVAANRQLLSACFEAPLQSDGDVMVVVGTVCAYVHELAILGGLSTSEAALIHLNRSFGGEFTRGPDPQAIAFTAESLGIADLVPDLGRAASWEFVNDPELEWDTGMELAEYFEWFDPTPADVEVATKLFSSLWASSPELQAASTDLLLSLPGSSVGGMTLYSLSLNPNISPQWIGRMIAFWSGYLMVSEVGGAPSRPIAILPSGLPSAVTLLSAELGEIVGPTSVARLAHSLGFAEASALAEPDLAVKVANIAILESMIGTLTGEVDTPRRELRDSSARLESVAPLDWTGAWASAESSIGRKGWGRLSTESKKDLAVGWAVSGLPAGDGYRGALRCWFAVFEGELGQALRRSGGIPPTSGLYELIKACQSQGGALAKLAGEARALLEKRNPVVHASPVVPEAEFAATRRKLVGDGAEDGLIARAARLGR